MAEPTKIRTAYVEIKIDGQNMPGEVIDCVTEVTVENTLHLPDVAIIRIEDEKFDIHQKDMFKIGKSVEISFGAEKNQLTQTFSGEIVAKDHDMAAHMVASFAIRCYDKSHRLHRGRERGSFQNVKDSDIVSQLAQRVGLRANVDATAEVHPYVYQNNQTNWEFINQLAQRNNFRTFVASDNTLHFKKLEESPNTTVSLDWGKNLTSFRPRVSSSGQVPKVIVRSWDPKEKKAIVGQATSPQALPQLGMNTKGGEIASQAFGQSAMVIVDRVPRSQEAATKQAQSILDEIAGGFVEADGLCEFHKDLKPGAQIEINNIGQHLSGKYRVTTTTHHYSSTEGLSSQFAISGKNPTSLTAAMSGGSSERQRLGGGVVVGIVVDNKDPLGQGRLKLKIPSTSDEDSSNWARLVSPMAGASRGFQFIPEIDDEVLVAFEDGDVHQPYVLGALWNGKDAPGEDSNTSVVSGKVERRTIKSRIGHLMLMDDTDGKGEVSFKTTNGHFVCMDDKNENILLKTKQGHQIMLDDKGKKILVQDMTGSNKMTIDSSAGSIDIQCTGDFSVTAGKSMSFTAGQNTSWTVGINYDMTVGAQFSLTSGATTSMTAGGTFTITGSMVNIN